MFIFQVIAQNFLQYPTFITKLNIPVGSVFPASVTPHAGALLPGLGTQTGGQAGETGRADAGNIRVNVSDSVSVSGGSGLYSDTYKEGNAGNVTIEGRDGVVPVVSSKSLGRNPYP